MSTLISCSLLIRRGFVPPIKRDQQDEGGSNFGEEVRSRVLYGAKGSSSKGSAGHQLPPELEGDERLRNIEPRMVELITNEVRCGGNSSYICCLHGQTKLRLYMYWTSEVATCTCVSLFYPQV